VPWRTAEGKSQQRETLPSQLQPADGRQSAAIQHLFYISSLLLHYLPRRDYFTRRPAAPRPKVSMASHSTDAHSQPRRPAPMTRQPSTSSQVSQSPSDTSHHKATLHKVQRQHVVGRPQRNHSSKNLNKATKQAQVQAQVQAQAQAQNHGGDGAGAARHHHRNHSGSTSAPSSPRPSFKRHASSGAIVRGAHQQHGTTGIRKNHSSGHLARQSSSKNVLKTAKSDARKPPAHSAKAREPSPDAHPTVHFEVGDEEESADEGWTEESASQSPTTTRSNTRSNSVIVDPQKSMDTNGGQSSMGEPSQTQTQTHTPQMHPPPPATTHALPDRTRNAHTNGGTSHHTHSRPPDADMITSRLLQRSSSHNPPPQISSIAASVVSNSHDARVLGQSAGSTLVDTPGRDLVSRFMDGDGSGGTPKDSSFLPSRDSPQSAAGDFDRAKRNISMPNFAGTDSPRAPSRRSGTTTPTDLPPSRTQQKLLLQRAHTNIEPHKLVPAILPRTGGPTFLHSGMTYNANGEGRLDPRLQQQFNHVAVEYNVVRRYRNPVVDAVVRIHQTPGVTKKSRTPKSAGRNGFMGSHNSSGQASLSASFNESAMDTDGAGSRRPRTSLENGRGSRDEADAERRQSFDSENERIRNEAEELCRRLWESSEAVEGD
jgi:hypothetical protein